MADVVLAAVAGAHCRPSVARTAVAAAFAVVAAVVDGPFVFVATAAAVIADGFAVDADGLGAAAVVAAPPIHFRRRRQQSMMRATAVATAARALHWTTNCVQSLLAAYQRLTVVRRHPYCFDWQHLSAT